MSKTTRTDPAEIMIVNDSPGEECRIAILEDGHLEELYTERAATATGVGNIYKGRVTKVEPAIQAAFVDYGNPAGASGFLHISDLHPRYFPRGDKTERVGKRTARRDRPLIQEALRSGQEVLVQVLKEGIGTKGPTLTSYLSIPGRLMVMMPDMDRVGVSRKVEDEDKRLQMRQILDQLDLPEGFGFILRTAGFDKTKTELKRDVAYLTRLWKVMEMRMKTTGAPCELYTESDLLIRTVRDVLRPSIAAIVVDSKSAYDRATAFLRVVAPRSAPKVVRYRGGAPIFHAFDIERQIELIHGRDVPLPSGGALVIEQTEALVAIDVNSGRSRSARDSETNAYQTNIEAVDEISRQLRLRDLGGLVIMDLIDMRFQRHRTDIEERFKAHLKRDRARWTINHISEFGVLEMTRQRMRPSLRKSHYMDCPHCEGRGEVKIPESLGADALRQISYLLQFDRVKRVELVCSNRVGSVLLSRKRRELVDIEEETGKTIDVRVSESIAIDRVDYYAYDERGADIDIQRLPALRQPTVQELEKAEAEAAEREAKGVDETTQPDESAGGRRRRGRRGRHGPADAMTLALSGDFDLDLEDEDDEPLILPGQSAEAAVEGPMRSEQPSEGGERGGRRRRRRRGRRGRGRGEQDGFSPALVAPGQEAPVQEMPGHELQSEPILAGGEMDEGASHRSRRDRRDHGDHGRGEPSPRDHAEREPRPSADEPLEIEGPPEELRLADEPYLLDDDQPPVAADAERPVLVPVEDEELMEAQALGEEHSPAAAAHQSEGDDGGPRKRRRRRGRRGRGGRGHGDQPPGAVQEPQVSHHDSSAGDSHPPSEQGDDAASEGGRGRRRRRRRGRRGGGQIPTEAGAAPERPGSASPQAVSDPAPVVVVRPRRSLYRSRTKISAGMRAPGGGGDDDE